MSSWVLVGDLQKVCVCIYVYFNFPCSEYIIKAKVRSDLIHELYNSHFLWHTDYKMANGFNSLPFHIFTFFLMWLGLAMVYFTSLFVTVADIHLLSYPGENMYWKECDHALIPKPSNLMAKISEMLDIQVCWDGFYASQTKVLPQLLHHTGVNVCLISFLGL